VEDFMVLPFDPFEHPDVYHARIMLQRAEEKARRDALKPVERVAEDLHKLLCFRRSYKLCGFRLEPIPEPVPGKDIWLSEIRRMIIHREAYFRKARELLTLCGNDEELVRKYLAVFRPA
jgi:hypothetical protein